MTTLSFGRHGGARRLSLQRSHGEHRGRSGHSLTRAPIWGCLGRVSNATLPTIVTTAPPVTITGIVVTSILPAPPSEPPPVIVTPKPPPVTVTAEASPPPRSQDRQFLDALAAAALVPDDPVTTVADAHGVCSYLALGHSEQDVVMFEMSNPHPNVTRDVAEKLTRIVVKVYCPQFAGG